MVSGPLVPRDAGRGPGELRRPDRGCPAARRPSDRRGGPVVRVGADASPPAHAEDLRWPGGRGPALLTAVAAAEVTGDRLARHLGRRPQGATLLHGRGGPGCV